MNMLDIINKLSLTVIRLHDEARNETDAQRSKKLRVAADQLSAICRALKEVYLSSAA